MFTKYDNPPTVVVVAATNYSKRDEAGWLTDEVGVWLIRRGNKDEDGYGKWALPGGYQEGAETWQETAFREVKEETGLELSTTPHLVDVVTVNKKNLLFCRALVVEQVPVVTDEASEVRLFRASDPAPEFAFPTHKAFFNKILYTPK